jgi:hypothetical protein
LISSTAKIEHIKTPGVINPIQAFNDTFSRQCMEPQKVYKKQILRPEAPAGANP